MKRLAFVGNSEPPGKLLEIFKKQTPGNSGIWKNLKGIDNYKDADYFAVIDWLPPKLGIDENKCVFLGAHPESMSAYRNMDNYKCLAKADCKHTVGFLEWWIEYDYDYLKALKVPCKTKNLCSIVSNARTQPYHTSRIEWLKRFTERDDLDFNLYGRIIPDTDNMKRYYRGHCGSFDPRGSAASGGNNHMIGKEQVLLDHKFIVDFDATGQNYFSERILDDILLWCMPIYWGGSNLHKFIDNKSFKYFDINKNGEDVLEFLESNKYEDYIESISNAREQLLDKWQLWPRIHELIFGEN